jgi:hypothetical protein
LEFWRRIKKRQLKWNTRNNIPISYVFQCTRPQCSKALEFKEKLSPLTMKLCQRYDNEQTKCHESLIDTMYMVNGLVCVKILGSLELIDLDKKIEVAHILNDDDEA